MLFDIKLLLLAVLVFNGNALNLKRSNNTTRSIDAFLQTASNDLEKISWKAPMDIQKRKPPAIGRFPKITKKLGGIVNYNNQNLPKCPNGLTHYKQGKIALCALITKKTIFPPHCPHPSTLEYRDFIQDFNITKDEHWAFTSGNVSEIGENNCFVTGGQNKNAIIPTKCNNEYPGICIYDPIQFFGAISPDYCIQRYNKSCISYNYDSGTVCYCKIKFYTTNHHPRNTFCKKLIEITDPYQNRFLKKRLNVDEKCWIGLQKFGDSLQWSYTNTTINYTHWSFDTDFSKPYGALGHDGWLLEKDGALNCAICEIEDKTPPQVQINIKHNKTTNTLDLEITNPIGAYKVIDCFNSVQKKMYNKKIFLDSTKKLIKEQVRFNFGTSAYYWCKALQIPHLTPLYSNTVFIPTRYGHEFSLTLTESYKEIGDDSECDSLKDYLSSNVLYSEPVKILKYNENNKTLEVVCHITIKHSRMSITEEFDLISRSLKDFPFKISNLASIEACLPSLTISGSQILNWPETSVGATTIPEELCLQEDESPVTRTCCGDFYHGSQWKGVNGNCFNKTNSDITQILNNLLKYNTMVSKEILQITATRNNFSSYQIHLLSEVLEKFANSNETVNITEITKTFNNIMGFEPNKLNIAHNSTDSMLYNLDKMLARTEIGEDGYTSVVTEKLLTQISNMEKITRNGIKVKKIQNANSSKIIPLQQETSQEDLIKEENLELAVLIPDQLHNDIIKCLGEKVFPNLTTTVFYNDSLFNQENNSIYHVDGNIIGVTIPNFNCTFSKPLQIIFNSSSNSKTRLKCASWVYGVNGSYGYWNVEGDPKSCGHDSNYQVCEFSHITHFTLLISGIEISEGHKKALDIITAIGSGLSLLGIFMVFLTAIVFKRFRLTNAIVLNFSVATTVQIVLLFVADNLPEDKLLCTIFGAVLHFSVLAQFFWMLTIAILQYRRYVIVFSSPTRHLVAKMCSVSWGIPLIVVITLVAISRDIYGKHNGLCYVVEKYFTYGVVIPVGSIIFINLLVFLRIMFSIASSRKMKVHQKKDETYSLQLRLAVMLFFLLGLTWGFGLFTSISSNIIFSYLFCITATLQGFILFLYFIVLNEKTRLLWTNLKTCHFKDNTKKYNNFNNESTNTTLERRPPKIISDNDHITSTSVM